MFVLVTPAFLYALFLFVSRSTSYYDLTILTDLDTGEVAYDVGTNLKTPLSFSANTLLWLPVLSSD